MITPAEDCERVFAAAVSAAGAAASLLRLPWRRNAWRGPSGEWSGVGLGNSVDFQDHRPYSPGDDLRYVNWAAFARTDALMLKVHRHEAAPAVDLVCDVSASMWLGEAKARRSAELMLFALESSERHAGGVRCHAVYGKTVTPLESAALRRGVLPAAEASGEPPALDRVPWRAEALRVLVSDLLFPPANGVGWTRRLGGPRGLGLVLVPWSAEEAAPDWDGRMDFEDCENGARREQRVDADLLARYRGAYARHIAGWRESFRRAGVMVARVPAEPDLIAALNSEALPAGAIEPQR
ncbi:MAG TPA: DUF58 domain-containing protein [Opitutaceae bacterium]|nr:DUF58 domain-containing protein [Opitutaceae bacterium]